ncbi:MAG: DUF6089 family protein [Prolixibacteraceae bacterium]|nr:DUF6089 family protein [Prolixibacteraceae bacterium]
MKRFFLHLLFLAISANLLAQQQTADIGLFGGGAVPISDYSKLKIGQSVNLNYGGFYRYNFNSRYSLRINALYGKVGASGYLDNEQSLISFNKSVVDLGAYFEINYLDFLLGVEHMKFSPYVFYGIGFSIYQGTNGNSVITGSIPFGTGVKYAFAKSWAVGAEVSARKLFNDELDNQSDPYGIVNLEKVNDLFHNNDWITYFGLTLTYKFYWGKKPCPAYNSIND